MGNIEVKQIDLRAVKKFELLLANKRNIRKKGIKKTPKKKARGKAKKDYPRLGKKTKALYLISLRGMLRYLAKMSIPSLPPNQIELPKKEDRHIIFLTETDVDKLFLAVGQVSGEPFVNARNEAILQVLFSTGMRISEMLSLGRNSVNMETGEISIRGKRKKVRAVFFSTDALKSLKYYLAVREDDLDYLFISIRRLSNGKMKHGRLTRQAAWQMIKDVAKKAEICKDISPHTLRHSFATTLINNGADISEVQLMLGHEDISTTKIYTHITNPKLRALHKSVFK